MFESFFLADRMYVHASYAEALPLVIIEAMAAGLPVVTTSAGGAARNSAVMDRRPIVVS